MRRDKSVPMFALIAALAFWVMGFSDSVKADAGTFAGKRVVMIVGFSPGGGTDLLGRLIAKSLGDNLPGKPSIIVRNVPGASGMKAMDYILRQTKPDGLTVVMATGSQVDPINYSKLNTPYNPKLFPVIGGFTTGGSAVLISKDVESRLYDKSAKPVVMGSTGNLPRNAMQMVMWGIEYLDWNARWITGYKGTGGLMTAMERKEIDMTATGNVGKVHDLVANGNFKILTQSGAYRGGKLRPSKQYGDAPVFADLMEGKITNKIEKAAFQYWRNTMTADKWFGLTPGSPDDIVKVYRDSWGAISSDEKFVKVANKIRANVVPMDHVDMSEIIWSLVDTPDAALEFTKELMKRQGFTPG